MSKAFVMAVNLALCSCVIAPFPVATIAVAQDFGGGGDDGGGFDDDSHSGGLYSSDSGNGLGEDHFDPDADKTTHPQRVFGFHNSDGLYRDYNSDGGCSPEWSLDREDHPFRSDACPE